MDQVCGDQLQVADAFTTRDVTLTFFGIGLQVKAKSARSEVHLRLAALLKEQCMGKRFGLDPMQWEQTLLGDLVRWDQRALRTIDIDEEHLRSFQWARSIAEQILSESKAETIDQVHAVFTTRLQSLLDVDATFELEMALLGYMAKDGGKQALAAAVLRVMPDEHREMSLDESIAGLQQLTTAPCATMLPEVNKGPLTVALQVLTCRWT